MVARSTESLKPSTSADSAVSAECTPKERRQHLLLMESGYDWRSFQKDVKLNDKRQRAEWRLIRKNQRINHCLQQKGECQCNEPAEDCNDDERLDFTGPTQVHVATQVNRTVPEVSSSIVVLEGRQVQTASYRCTTVAMQTGGPGAVLTAAMQTVDRTSWITRNTEEQPDQQINRVSVFANQREKYEYWTLRLEQLKYELDVAKQVIDHMLSGLVVQIHALTQSVT